MTTDRNGIVISEGDDVLLCGPIIDIDGDVVHVTTGDGRHVFRVNAGDVAKTTGYQLFDKELDAVAGLKSADDTGIHFTGSGSAALHDLTSLGRSIAGKATRREVAELLGMPWIVGQESSGSAIGSSSTAWHEVFSFTIPANSLGTKGRAIMDFAIRWNVESGNTKGQWKVNGNTVWSNSGNIMSAGTGTAFYATFCAHLAANNSTAAQNGGWQCQVANDQSKSVDEGTALGGWLYNQGEGAGGFADSDEDSTSDITFSFEAGFNTSHASNSLTLQSARLLIEPGL